MIRKLLSAAFLAAALMSIQTASAGILTFTANLTGAAEAPPNASPATGFATVVVDDILNTLSLDVTFAGLLGGTTVAHIHCCTAAPNTGVANVATQTPSFVGFPAGVTSGSYSETFDLTLASTYRAGFITDSGGTVGGAQDALLTGLLAGKAYLNLHSGRFAGGEIRGFLHVPEPQTLSFAALLLLALPALRRRRTVA